MGALTFCRWLVVACFFACPVLVQAAGSASALIGGGAVKGAGGAWGVRGASAQAANGAFNTPATVTAAGKVVTMPASAAFAANAASFAVTAVRLNPTGLVVGLVVPWLITKGLTYANGNWNKETAGVVDTAGRTGWAYKHGLSTMIHGSPAAAAAHMVSIMAGAEGYRDLTKYSSSDNYYVYIDRSAVYGDYFAQILYQGYCVSGYTMVASQCVPDNSTAPATESDFTNAGSGQIPDNVAQQLAQADVLMPVSAPVLNPAPKTEDYGNPYVDPVTGKTVQTKTLITPDPSADDPYKVRVESYNVEIAPAPAPVLGDPVPVPKDEQPKDPCLDNPNRLGCMDGGTPEDVQLDTQAAVFSVNPIAVGGAGACPPDPVIGAHGFSMVLKLGPICDAAGWLRPLVLALAWFSAALIVGGAVRES